MTRIRSTWPAMTAAMILILALAATAFGATLAPSGDTDDALSAPLISEALTEFVDADGDGIADSCDDEVVPDPEAAAAAEAAVDEDGDGTVSVSEAAHSDRTGGKNCNHGGYVSTVAQQSCEDGAPEEGSEPAEGTEPEEGSEPAEGTEEALESSDCDEETEESVEDAEADQDAECVEVAAPTFDPVALGAPGGFGAYVSSVAQSDAVGGKNCNHGGAVSEAVKAAQAEAKAARDAAKAERKAERDAAKAERAAAKAAKSAGGHGKGKPATD